MWCALNIITIDFIYPCEVKCWGQVENLWLYRSAFKTFSATKRKNGKKTLQQKGRKSTIFIQIKLRFCSRKFPNPYESWMNSRLFICIEHGKCFDSFGFERHFQLFSWVWTSFNTFQCCSFRFKTCFLRIVLIRLINKTTLHWAIVRIQSQSILTPTKRFLVLLSV